MKKRILTTMLASVMIMGTLAGCTKENSTVSENIAEPEEVIATEEVEPEETADEELTEDGSVQIEESYADVDAFYDFLDGKEKVVASDNVEGCYEAMADQKMSLQDIKDILEEAMEVVDSTIHYTILTMEEEHLLAIRYESNADEGSISLSWTGLIVYDDGKLVLQDYYSDGYRTFATLYKNGILVEGGSCSAGESITMVCQLENGCIVPYRVVNECFETWIADKINSCAPFPERVDEIAMDENSPYHLSPISDSGVCVYFLTSGDDLKVTLSSPYGEEDEAAVNMYETLEYLGFTMTDLDEVDAYVTYGQEDTEEVEWTDL